MKTRSVIAVLAVVAMAFPAFGAQEPGDGTTTTPPTVININANGTDVREVLHGIFTQAEKSFVVEVGLYLRLYLNLQEVPFDKAIDILCKNVGMDYKIEDDIYMFFRPRHVGAQVATIGRLDPNVLNKTLTTRLDQADIRKVAAELAKATQVPIEVSPEVKALKVNATLLNTSLRFALNSITQAARLTYSFTDHGTILISDPTTATSSTAVTTTSQSATAAINCDQCKTDLKKGWVYCPSCGNYVKNLTGQN